MDIKDRVIQIVAAKADIPGNTEAERLACDFFKEGVLDSIKIVELVSELESEFGVTFSYEDMQSQQFRTMGGLVALLERLTR